MHNPRPFAIGNKIRELQRLQKTYGKGRWRKCKGEATIQMNKDGRIRRVELHWYEAQGIGKKEVKPKRDLV
jgi:hypothetical protein